MSSHAFAEIYLHFNWHTKNDLPLITPEIEPSIYTILEHKCRSLKGVSCLGIGGTETHCHAAIQIEPYVNISETAGQLKGASSRILNLREGEKSLEWQRGYGVVSFSKSQLPQVLDYIAHQKDHHARGLLWPKLEEMHPELEAEDSCPTS
jgi:REP element-mobilizing transposase RayT